MFSLDFLSSDNSTLVFFFYSQLKNLIDEKCSDTCRHVNGPRDKMVAERLSAVPSCHGKKEHTSRLFVPPLLWDCLVLFLMDKITCVWHV